MGRKGRMVQCPICKRRVQLKNIKKHYRKHHPGVTPPKDSELLNIRKTPLPFLKTIPWGKITTGIVALLLIAVGVHWYINRSKGLQPLEKAFFTEDGMYIFSYLLIQDITHPTVILLHDIDQNHHAFDKHLEFFYSMGYNVCTLDLRGFGKSVYKRGVKISLDDIKSHEYANYTKDVGGLIRYLKDNYQIHGQISILGAGLGASVGALYSIHDTNVKLVILLSPQMEIMNLGLYRFTEDYGIRSIMIVVSKLDTSSYQTAMDIYDSAKDGKRKVVVDEPLTSTDLLNSPKVMDGIKNYLNDTLPI